MSWNAELIVKYQSISEMMDATLETGANKLAPGTIAIVEEDNFNRYIWYASIIKWKPQIGNKYTSANLPSVTDFVLDEGDEIWDTSLGLKRRWVGLEWELQKDVEYVMLAGHGLPTPDMGKYGNYYTDLNNGNKYVKNVFGKAKIDALSMFDAGVLTVTVPTSGYTIERPRTVFVDAISPEYTFSSGKMMYIQHEHTNGIPCDVIFDFHGSPQCINIIQLWTGGLVTPHPSGTWDASNDGVVWETQDVFSTLKMRDCRVIKALETTTTYRYHRLHFQFPDSSRQVSFCNIVLQKLSGDPTWTQVSSPVSLDLLSGVGEPSPVVGTKDSKYINITTGDVYYKDDISGGKIPLIAAAGQTYVHTFIDGLFTTNWGGSNRDVFTLASETKIDRVVFKRQVGSYTNMYFCVMFGSTDNVVWDYIYTTPEFGTQWNDIVVDISDVPENRPFKYLKLWYSINSGYSELELYSDELVSWRLSHNLKSINASSFNNQLNTTIVDPQLLANHINAQHPTVNITTDTTLTPAQFTVETRFKVNSTDPVKLQLPTLSSAENNKAIEIIKLSKGDVVATTTNSIGKPTHLALINNNGDIGESVVVEYSSEVSMFLVKNIFGSWIISATVPIYVTLTSVVVSGDGLSWVFTFSGNVIAGSDGFNVGLLIGTTWIGAHTLTYFSGSGTSVITYHSNRYIDSTDTISAGSSYTQPGKGISDPENNSIKSVAITSVTNNSTLSLPSIVTASIDTNGVSWSFTFDQNITYTTLPNMFTVTMVTAGVVTLTYSSGAGTPTIVFTGNKTITATDTVTSGLNYNATNKSWYTPITLLPLKAFSNFLIINGSTQP